MRQYRTFLITVFFGLLPLLLLCTPAYSQDANAASVGHIVILVHGDSSDADVYRSGFIDTVWPDRPYYTALIEFNWGNEFIAHASGTVGTRETADDPLAKGMSAQAWEGADKLRTVVKQAKAILPGVPVTIVSHSQGTVLTLAALQDGMKIDNWVLMGSPLYQETIAQGDDNTHLGKAAANVSNRVVNFWSPDDQVDVAITNNRVGRYGLPRNSDQSFNIADYTANNITEVRLDHVGHTDYWPGKWIAGGVDYLWSVADADGNRDATLSDELPDIFHQLLVLQPFDTTTETCFVNLQVYASIYPAQWHQVSTCPVPYLLGSPDDNPCSDDAEIDPDAIHQIDLGPAGWKYDPNYSIDVGGITGITFVNPDIQNIRVSFIIARGVFPGMMIDCFGCRAPSSLFDPFQCGNWDMPYDIKSLDIKVVNGLTWRVFQSSRSLDIYNETMAMTQINDVTLGVTFSAPENLVNDGYFPDAEQVKDEVFWSAVEAYSREILQAQSTSRS